MEQYNVTIYLNNTEGESITLKGTISFHHDPEQYGNGYTMYVKGFDEPFGGQGYDIRYDNEFDKDEELLYIVKFYATRYDGKAHKNEHGRRWRLAGIRVHEAEEV